MPRRDVEVLVTGLRVDDIDMYLSRRNQARAAGVFKRAAVGLLARPGPVLDSK